VAVTASVRATWSATQTAALDLGTAKAPAALDLLTSFLSGTAAYQADLHWTDRRTLTASASENLDLAGGLVDPFGVTITFARVRAWFVAADIANANTVVVGGAASNAWATWCGATTHTVTIRPGGIILFVAPDVTGYAVTAATADLLKILNGGAGTSVVYTAGFLGASV